MFNTNDIDLMINGSVTTGALKIQHRIPLSSFNEFEMININESPVIFYEQGCLYYGQIILLKDQRHNVASIKLNEFWIEDVRYISSDDCSRCGYTTSYRFLSDWISEHDAVFKKKIDNKKVDFKAIMKRPEELYSAICFNFDLLYYSIDENYLKADINYFIEQQLEYPPSVEQTMDYLDYYFPKSDKDVISNSSLIKKSLPLIRRRSLSEEEMMELESKREKE